VVSAEVSDENRKGREGPETDEFPVEEIELDPDLPPEILEQGIEVQRLYSILGLVFGVIIVLAGVVLMVLGFSGSVDIAFQSGTTKAHVVTGSLGIVVALIGAILVWVTRFKVRITRPKNE
jgi:hypothetical protein